MQPQREAARHVISQEHKSQVHPPKDQSPTPRQPPAQENREGKAERTLESLANTFGSRLKKAAARAKDLENKTGVKMSPYKDDDREK